VSGFDLVLNSGTAVRIDGDCPVVEYKTGASIGDFIRFSNNGEIVTQSVTNSAITDIQPNSLVLSHPSAQTAMDLDSDLGMRFSTALSGVNSNFSSSQIQFNSSPLTSLMNASGYRGSIYNNAGTTSSPTPVFPSFVPSSVAGYGSPSTFSNLSYTPSTNLLSANISGSAGSATNATNVAIIDQPTTNTTYYLTFVTATSGNQPTYVDSSTLTYNSSTNLLLVNGLQLGTATNSVTFASNSLTIDCNSASSREFNFPITADMNGLNLTNRRTNGVYKVMITNTSGANRTINNTLATTTGQPNRTSYNPSAVISVGDTWIMTIKVQNFAGTQYNCVSLEKFV
jgi:hypothetical protein